MTNFAALYHQVNWQQLWYKTLCLPKISDNDLSHFDTVAQWLNTAIPPSQPLVTQQNKPIIFVLQAALPANTAYESFIHETGQIPTRNNLHDLINGLIWLNFPKTKAILNYLHTLDIAKNGVGSHRSPLRNALTLFDENGGIVVSSDTGVLTQLQNFEWEKALFHNRELWQSPQPSVQFFPLGHALLEKLVFPRKNITSHGILLQVKPDFFTLSIAKQRQKLDKILAKRFLTGFDTLLQSKNFQPLPVMGIPSFCEENTFCEFYQDKTVFRAPKERKALILPLFTA